MAARSMPGTGIAVAFTVFSLIGPTAATAETLSFQQGVGSYSGTCDTHLDAAAFDMSFGDDPTITVDGFGGGSLANHALVWFKDIFGEGAGQIPMGSEIQGATLTIQVLQCGDVGATVHRMLMPWTEDDTWQEWVDGVASDDIEAASTIDATIGNVCPGPLPIDVTVSLQQWSDGSTNYGWFFKPGDTSPDGWIFSSSEAANVSMRPMLVVEYLPPQGCPEQCGTWTQVAEIGPQARFARIAFDSARGVVVLYGGAGGPGVHFDDTWEWDGVAWTQRDVTGPGGLEQLTLAFDEARGETLLFGGSTGQGNDQDRTWTWDGTQWTERSDCGPRPPARVNPAMAYDPLRERVVMFGGYTHPPQAQYFGDTWEWDGSCWTQVADSGPSPRESAAMTFDSSRQRVVLHGGLAAQQPAGDGVWEWDGTAWTQSEPCATPRTLHGMTFDESHQSLLILGGYNFEQYLGDTWSDCTLCELPSYGARSVSAAYDSIRDVTVIFGGFSAGGLLGDTWEYQSCTQQGAMDIKPGSCPNPFNLRSNGFLPVALLGAENFDVSMVDLTTLEIGRLDGTGDPVGPNEGPPGPHTVVADVGTPFDGTPCECHDAGPDGFDDLSIKFRRQDLVDALELDGWAADTPVQLILTGAFVDGTVFEAIDCIQIVPGTADVDASGEVGSSDVLQVILTWGDCSSPCPEDVDDSGAVDSTDLLEVIGAWGSRP